VEAETQVSHVHFIATAAAALIALFPDCSSPAPPAEATHGDSDAGPSASASGAHAATPAPPSSGAVAMGGHGGGGGGGAHGSPPGGPLTRKFGVPFTWETSQDDALRTTRGFMQGFFSDNNAYVRSHDGTFFKPFVQTQKPRATVLTCADSRVQTQAFDAKPENDVFLIRNIGNQVVNAEGSVEYGIHHLKTHVLVVMGHTGCGAVKARMGDISKESDAIRHELEPLSVPGGGGSKEKIDDKAWQEAVVSNVNDQVRFALLKFASEVETGDLTVVGAVYDLRNDMKQGYGHIALVNINGNTDATKLTAFEKAVSGAGSAQGVAAFGGPMSALLAEPPSGAVVVAGGIPNAAGGHSHGAGEEEHHAPAGGAAHH